jgi:hypothetical protein
MTTDNQDTYRRGAARVIVNSARVELEGSSGSINSNRYRYVEDSLLECALRSRGHISKVANSCSTAWCVLVEFALSILTIYSQSYSNG